jgi:hypothetical protein
MSSMVMDGVMQSSCAANPLSGRKANWKPTSPIGLHRGSGQPCLSL